MAAKFNSVTGEHVQIQTGETAGFESRGSRRRSKTPMVIFSSSGTTLVINQQTGRVEASLPKSSSPISTDHYPLRGPVGRKRSKGQLPLGTLEHEIEYATNDPAAR